VTSIGTLVGAAGSVCEGRWRCDDDALGVRLTLSDKSSRLYRIPSSATTQAEWTLWAATGVVWGGALDGKEIASIGIPGFGPGGVVFPAVLKIGTGGVVAGTDNVLLHATSGGLTIVAREGDAAPGKDGTALTGALFKSFGNPLHGPAGKLAFAATLSSKQNSSGIWWLDGASPLRLIARVGDPAPPLGTFAKFTNIVLPDTAGSVPIFTAKLTNQAEVAISGATLDGVWALNNAGNVTLVARNGSYFGLFGSSPSEIASGLIAFTTPASSQGAAHGVDASGAVRMNAKLTHFSTKVKRRAQFAVPVPQP
jgi:hypothetical protein